MATEMPKRMTEKQTVRLTPEAFAALRRLGYDKLVYDLRREPDGGATCKVFGNIADRMIGRVPGWSVVES